MNHVWQRVLCAVIAVPALVSQPERSWAQAEVYLSDLPKQFPTAYANWKKTVPYAIKMPDWLLKLNGVVSPVHDLTINGVRYKFGTVCVPHDCGGNIAGVLFTQAQDRIGAIVTLSSELGPQTVMTIGQLSNAEIGCIKKATDDYKLTAC